MKNMFKKAIVTFVVAVTMVSCLAFTAFAGTPRWSHWTMLSGEIVIKSENKALISVVCDCSSAEANKVKVTTELQQFDGSWKTIKSWTESRDSTGFLMEKTYGIAKGYSYRLKVTARAYKDTKLLETVTETFDYGYYQ